jgi:hypothetical protein
MGLTDPLHEREIEQKRDPPESTEIMSCWTQERELNVSCLSRLEPGSGFSHKTAIDLERST